MLRRPLVAANWKMHGGTALVAELAQALTSGVKAEGGSEILICPPYVYLAALQQAFSGSPLKLGGQNMHEAEQGAFTGEISASMLQEHGCSHVILGHSERRTLFGEDDALVASKFAAALKAGLVPVLCVGESEAERNEGSTEAVVRRQLQAVISACGIAAFDTAVIAYEPVWAIGTGLTATPEQAQQVHALIRGELRDAGSDKADAIRILYGGSVKAANAAELFAQADIDGALVGGASLIAEEFLSICRSAAGD